jgi:hypothetical protein
MKGVLYWFIQLTWGICLTAIGGILTFVFILMGHKPRRFGYSIYVEVGKHWGGVNFGGIFFVQKGASISLKSHEYGHSFQNLWLGPLMPFLITIPSAIRYHYRIHMHAKGHSLGPYEDVWFEKWATELGERYYKI